MESQAAFHRFGGVPFLLRRLPGLAETVLMNTAPLSKRFNFDRILSRFRETVNRFSKENSKICAYP